MEASTYLLSAKIIQVIHGIVLLYLLSIIFAFFLLNGKYRLRYYLPAIIMLSVQIIFIFVNSLINSFKEYNCCLTNLELFFLNLAGKEKYNYGFTVHYLEKIGINISEAMVNFYIGTIFATVICVPIIFFLRKRNKASP
jgi:hypothetical protein